MSTNPYYFFQIQDENNSTENIEETDFMKSPKPKKIVTFIGPAAEGKTTTMNSIIQMKQKQNLGHTDFQFSQSRSNYPGIRFYDEQSILFVEFENIDYSQDNEITQYLRECMFYFISISICVFYEHHSIRLTKGFEDLANKIQLISKNKQFTFVEILNKWNGDKIESYKDLQNFQGLFQKAFYLKCLNFRNSQIAQDNNFKQYQGQIQDIVSYIDGLEFNNESTYEDVRLGICNLNTKITQNSKLYCKIEEEQNKQEDQYSDNENNVSDPLLGNRKVQPKINKVWLIFNILLIIITYCLPISTTKKYNLVIFALIIQILIFIFLKKYPKCPKEFLQNFKNLILRRYRRPNIK
ncbi:hypothetical protein ABPG74_005152 [Tetrahymena malaccensis]